MTAERIASADRASVNHVLEEGRVPLLVDPEGSSIPLLKPDIVVDAIIAKKNLGTAKEMAPLVIGVGPGFTAGEDVDLVVESMRGHNLARIFTTGSALSQYREFPVTSAVLRKRGFSMRRQPVI